MAMPCARPPIFVAPRAARRQEGCTWARAFTNVGLPAPHAAGLFVGSFHGRLSSITELLVQCRPFLPDDLRLNEIEVEKRFQHVEIPLRFAGFDTDEFP